MKFKRADGRAPDELRPVKIVRNFLKNPAGSVWIEFGDTKLICTAIIDESVPNHVKGSGGGWVTAEYSMIPGATSERNPREGVGRTRGRTHEIQRLIGRALRAVVDLSKLGERTIYLDADVIQADGGTRCAAITGSFVALYDALIKLKAKNKIKTIPITEFLAAASVGVVREHVLLDLPYSEDVEARVDMNIAMTETGRFVEIQGTAERAPFSKKQLDAMLLLASSGVEQLIAKQKEVLGI